MRAPRRLRLRQRDPGRGVLKQALIKDKQLENLFILPASQTRDKDALTQEGVEKVIDELKEMGFDYIVCDSPAGIEAGALMAAYFADDALVVTNPEVSSVRDSTASWASWPPSRAAPCRATSRSRNTCC